MREKHRPDMSEEEATALMHECLKASAGQDSCQVCLWMRCGSGVFFFLGKKKDKKPNNKKPKKKRKRHCCHLPAQVCYYRDKNSINKFQLAKVTAAGVTISGALEQGCMASTRWCRSWGWGVQGNTAWCGAPQTQSCVVSLHGYPATALGCVGATPQLQHPHPPRPSTACRAVCAGDGLELQAVCQPGGQRTRHVVEHTPLFGAEWHIAAWPNCPL